MTEYSLIGRLLIYEQNNYSKMPKGFAVPWLERDKLN